MTKLLIAFLLFHSYIIIVYLKKKNRVKENLQLANYTNKTEPAKLELL